MQEPAKRFIFNMEQKIKLPSSWQNGQKVQVVFPGNGKLQGKIIRVSFPENGETRYDVEVPYDHTDYDRGKQTGYFRIHAVPQWFLSSTQEDWDKMLESERKEALDKVQAERDTVNVMQKMCEESLDPETFEMWENVKMALKVTRRRLREDGPETLLPKFGKILQPPQE